LRFGSVLENVVVDPHTRRPDYADEHFTENTRGAYPVEYIDNYVPNSLGGHPANVVLLTCDAFGVMPPVSRLTPDQALYHFLSGYTAKVAGTEAGVQAPEATFSTCFGAPFLPLPPAVYAGMLREKVERHKTQVWLVNTGWTEGPPGKGHRIPLAHTRAMVRAILNGSLAEMSFVPDPVFRLSIPTACPGVPGQFLRPRQTWPDTDEYDNRARQLAGLFRSNFAAFGDSVSESVRNAGPEPQ
jgi:phosphoenolpyruvate carboxykinase (ATP)